MRVLGIGMAELIGGALTILLGLFVVVEASGYPIGTARNMGPGFFPVGLGILLMVSGAGILAVEGKALESPPFPALAWRALFALTAAILSFAFLIERFGLAPAVMSAVFLSCLAEEKVPWLKAAAIAVAMATVTATIFVFLLGLPLSVVRW